MKVLLKKLVRWPAFPALMLLIVFILINQLLSPGYLTKSFATSFLSANALVIIASIGVSIVIIGGGIDISMGGLLCLINVVYVTLAEMGYGLEICIIAALVAGLLGGLLNGICVSIFRVTPLLTTFATSTIFSGIALWIMPQPTGRIQVEMVKWVFTFMNGFGAPLIFILAAIAIWLIIKNTRMGTWIYAVGQSKQKAYVSGVPVTKVVLFMYTISGLIVGIAGVAMTSYVGSGDPLIAATQSMPIIASCVIGGILLSGGIGDAIGAVFGACFLGIVITTVLSSINDSFFHNFVQGVIMLIGVIGSIFLANLIGKMKTDIRRVK